MHKIIIVFLFSFLVISTQVFAQEIADSIPSGDQISSQVDFLKDQNKRPLKLDDAPVIEDNTVKKSKRPDSDTTITVETFNFQGNHVLTDHKLDSLMQPFKGKPITFSELQAAIDQITNLYRAQGYLISRAFIPPQKVTNQTLLIQILEGKIGNVKVEDNRWFKSKIYTDFFNKVNSDKAFEYNDLESALYFLNQKDDRQAKAFLEPGAEPETTDITLKAKETFPFHVSYGFNNRGSRLTHRARHMINIQHSNLTGHDDTFVAGMSLAEQAAFRASWIQYVFPIQSTGTELGISYSHARTRLAKHLRSFDIEGRYFEITPSIKQSIFKSRRLQLDWNASFEIKDSKSTIANIKTSFDRMRVLKTGPSASINDRWGKTLLSVNSHIGIGDFLGSLSQDDPNASRPGAGGTFVYYSGSLARINRLPLNSFLVTQIKGQWSPVTLSSLEQFRAGGMSSVRGYPESDSSGDRGYTISTELNFPIPFLPKDWKLPYTNKTYSETIRLVGFYDLGQTEFRSRRTPAEEKNRFLMGAGAGVRVNLKNYLNLQLDWGFPLGNESTDKDRSQIHFSVNAGF